MEILVLCGIYLVELVCFQLGLKMLFDVQVKTRKWMFIGIILPISIGFISLDIPDNDAWKNLLVTIAVISVTLISIKDRIVEKEIRLVFTFLLIECINAIFVPVCDRILIIFNVNSSDNTNYFAVNCFSMISIFLFDVIKERILRYKKTSINSIIYFILGVIAISMLFCLMFLNQVMDYLHYSKYIIFCSILDIAILFSIFFLVLFVIYIKNTHSRMEQLLKTEQILKESQVNYYKQALMKEIDTRKYRHDMVNHLVYIQNSLMRNKNRDAQNYLASLLGGFKKIQNTYFVVGNEMIDIIMNYFFGMLPDSVVVDIVGKCPVTIDLEETDICTIFSNILQNIVDEILENDIKDARIIIEVQKGMQYVQYVIKNSLITELSVDKNGLPRTHKLNKHNHGIGMANVKEAVERNNGKFKWYQEVNYFCVNVILPIRNE